MIIFNPKLQKIFQLVSKDLEGVVKFSTLFTTIPLFVGWVVLELFVNAHAGEGLKVAPDGNPAQVN